MSFPKIFLALIVLIGWSCEETEYPTIIEDRIEFYDIDTLPTIYIYKDKNLLNTIEGFLTKSELIKKINEVI